MSFTAIDNSNGVAMLSVFIQFYNAGAACVSACYDMHLSIPPFDHTNAL